MLKTLQLTALKTLSKMVPRAPRKRPKSPMQQKVVKGKTIIAKYIINKICMCILGSMATFLFLSFSFCNCRPAKAAKTKDCMLTVQPR